MSRVFSSCFVLGTESKALDAEDHQKRPVRRPSGGATALMEVRDGRVAECSSVAIVSRRRVSCLLGPAILKHAITRQTKLNQELEE